MYAFKWPLWLSLIGAHYVKHDVVRKTEIDKLYSPQMVVTANTTKYTIENDLTKKEKKKKRKTNKQTHRQMACTYLKKRPISSYMTYGIVVRGQLIHGQR